jgi:hypothetical protein
MKVFISWSGETSKAIAEVLRAWLPSVVQAIRPYFSPDDITKGSRWSTEIAKELEDCKVGLICLTADNLEAPWVMFEAGALSKSLSAARVCPLLFGIDASDVKGPLVQFQAAPFTRDEMKKAVRMMNQELGTSALGADVLDSVFDMWWPRLEETIVKVLSADRKAPKQSVRSERDILEEILARVRAAPSVSSTTAISPGALRDLLDTYDRLVLEVGRVAPDVQAGLVEIVERLRTPIDYIVRRTRGDEDLLLARREERLEMLRRRAIAEQEPSPDVMEDAIPKPKPNKRASRAR